jgi:GDP-4-dehydro-6-deoxy-D-mannose reductase
MSQKILITGVGGMVGSHMTDHYNRLGIRPVGIYFNSTIPLSEISGKADLVECDVRDPFRLLSIIDKYRPDVIHHLAAQSFPTVSWERPAETLDINMVGTVNVCEAVKIIRKSTPSYDPVIVVACSSAEYGASLTPDRTPISEDAPLLPLHPYGVSKVGQDLLAFQYHQSDGLKTIRARIFNTTGPRKSGDAASDFTRRAVEVENGIQPHLRVGKLTTRRALTDVRDLVDALILLAAKGTPGEVYNISGATVYMMQEIIDMILSQARCPIKIIEDPALFRPTDEPVIFGDSTRLKSQTGWIQKIPLKQTLGDMLSWWRNQITNK